MSERRGESRLELAIHYWWSVVWIARQLHSNTCVIHPTSRHAGMKRAATWLQSVLHSLSKFVARNTVPGRATMSVCSAKCRRVPGGGVARSEGKFAFCKISLCQSSSHEARCARRRGAYQRRTRAGYNVCLQSAILCTAPNRGRPSVARSIALLSQRRHLYACTHHGGGFSRRQPSHEGGMLAHPGCGQLVRSSPAT
jgi:hypothetical protein